MQQSETVGAKNGASGKDPTRPKIRQTNFKWLVAFATAILAVSGTAIPIDTA